jgi:hypothetical protein
MNEHEQAQAALKQVMAELQGLFAAIPQRPLKANRKLEKRHSHNRHLHDVAIIREPLGRNGDAELWIAYTGMREEALRLRATHPELEYFHSVCDPDALNGYVAFPKRRGPKLPTHYQGLVQYIPVHGGITYAVKDSFATVFGFDTAHWKSEDQPRTDPEWIRYQCHVLHHGLRMAEELWPKFRKANRDGKIAIAQTLFEECDPAQSGRVSDRLGFTALINLMCGKVG